MTTQRLGIGIAAALISVASLLLCGYYLARLLAPERTSHDYGAILSGEMQIPGIIIIGHREGTRPDYAKYLEDSRRAYLARALDDERRTGRKGAIVWGGVAAFWILLWWRTRRRRRHTNLAAV
jgi:hypothetical protein